MQTVFVTFSILKITVLNLKVNGGYICISQVQCGFFYAKLFPDHWNNRKNKRQSPLQTSFFLIGT